MSLTSERDLNANAKGIYSRAKAAEQSKNYDYAINLIQAALKEEPLFLEGRRFLRVIEIKKYRALSSFNKQMLSMKVSSSAMKLSSAGKKEPGEQLAIAEEVLALDPFHSKANALVGEAGTKLGFPEFKAFALETMAQAKPDDKSMIPVLQPLATTYMELRDFNKAINTFERILKIDPRDGDALSGLKNAHAAESSKSGGWEKAGGDYRDALKDRTGSIELEQQSKVVKSDEAIESQIQLNYQKWQEQPTNPVHSRAIAKLYEQQGNIDSAVEWYEEAFRAGNNVDTSLEKVIGDLKIKKSEQELQELITAEAEQEDPEVKTQYLPVIEQKKNEINEVRVAQAEARVRAFPNDPQYHFDLGEALYKIGQYRRALQELQIGRKQPSVRYQALNLTGKCFMSQGMLDLAVKTFSEAASELPVMDDLKKDIVYNLGLAYEATQQKDKSLEQWKKIYEVDMSYRDVGPRVEESYGG